MQKDIISEIKKLKKITDVVVLTHNIDFIFTQTVFLSALKKCGYPNLTILADSHCAMESYQYQSSVITGLGKRYRVIPVTMSPGFRFHAKAILLSGDESATLFVGSGNMTFGGIRENAEIWSRFDSSDENTEQFSAFKAYFSSILPFVGFPDEVEKDIADLFEQRNHSWASELSEPGGLWHSPGNKQSLAEIIVQTSRDLPARKLTVCTPYFDKKAKALRELSAQVGAPHTDVFLQSAKSTLLKNAADHLPDNIKIKSVKAIKEGETSNRFIHAKWYAIETANEVLFFHGSANCSVAALTGKPPRSNAELVVVSKITKSEFEDTVLSDLIVSDELPVLIDETEDDDETQTVHKISLNSARYQFGVLKVSFRCNNSVAITDLNADSVRQEFEIIGNTEVLAKLAEHPKFITLSGKSGTEFFTSNRIWVDDESSLRSNSTARNIIEKVRDAQKDSGHDPAKWVLIFELLNKNLSQMTSREIRGAKAQTGSDSADSVKISKGLLSTASYSNLPALAGYQGIGPGTNVSIYSLLLQSFGISGMASVDDGNDGDEGDRGDHGGDGNGKGTPDSDDNEKVDRPEEAPTKKEEGIKPSRPSQKEAEKLKNSAVEIVERFCDPEFLSARLPQRLSLDIQVIGLLLRKAYSMKWIEKQIFFDLSHKVWSNLFFHSASTNGKGWLESRFENDEEKDSFIASFVSPILTATLYAWFSAVSVEVGNVYSRRFLISQIMAMGRCPWLWFHEERASAQVTENLIKVWNDSPCDDSGKTSQQLYEEFVPIINSYGEVGKSLCRMRNELAGIGVESIRAEMVSFEVKEGDLLWQGKKGICIALEATDEYRQGISVLCLQEPEVDLTIQSNYLVPMNALIEAGNNFSSTFATEDKQRIRSFIKEFESY